MKKLIAAVFLSIAICAPESATAENTTLSVVFEPVTRGGVTAGCQLIYNATINDWAYKQGQLAKVEGHIAVMKIGENPATTLKVVLNDVHVSESGVRFAPSAPNLAYLRAPDGTSNVASLVEKVESDTPGGLYSIFHFDELFVQIFGQMLEIERVDVMFNRRDGGVDIGVPLDLTVIDVGLDGIAQKSSEHLVRWAKCSLALLQSD